MLRWSLGWFARHSWLFLSQESLNWTMHHIKYQGILSKSKSYSKILRQSLVQCLIHNVLYSFQSKHVFNASQNQEVSWAEEPSYLYTSSFSDTFCTVTSPLYTWSKQALYLSDSHSGKQYSHYSIESMRFTQGRVTSLYLRYSKDVW